MTRTKRQKRSYLIGALLILISWAMVTVNIAAFAHDKQAPLTASTPMSGSFSAGKGLVGFQQGADASTFSVEKLVMLTNQERAPLGLPVLTANEMLNKSAQLKCNDMITDNYWAHISPSGRQPWDFFANAGYNYDKAGENLAYGFASNESVIAGWMNSETHKANIMGNYTEVGFGVCESDDYMGSGHQVIVVQHFGTPVPVSTPASAAKPVYRPYVAPVCTKTPIPHKTDYVDASYMYVGESKTYEGWDGYIQTCTADSTGYKPADLTSQPYNTTVYVGTKVRETPVYTQPQRTYQQASAYCSASGVSSDSSAWQACINAYLSQ